MTLSSGLTVISAVGRPTTRNPFVRLDLVPLYYIEPLRQDTSRHQHDRCALALRVGTAHLQEKPSRPSRASSSREQSHLGGSCSLWPAPACRWMPTRPGIPRIPGCRKYCFESPLRPRRRGRTSNWYQTPRSPHSPYRHPFGTIPSVRAQQFSYRCSQPKPLASSVPVERFVQRQPGRAAENVETAFQTLTTCFPTSWSYSRL
jgi:hypothetical protein